VGPPASCAQFGSIGAAHGWGLLGGALWAVGTLSNLVSGSLIGPALSYALGQAAPMVATAWGLFYYREFDGCPLSSKLWVVGMFVTYAAAIASIAGSK
jgi:glucose uptake protein